MSEKTEAFIISKEESGDSSYVVTFYSKLFGKINLFVKSARTSKKRFQGKLESGNLYDIEFIKAKKLGSLDSLIKIDINDENRFINSFEEYVDQDLDWFFDPWLHTTRKLDYAISNFKTTKNKEDSWDVELVINNLGNRFMPIKIKTYFQNLQICS